MRASRAATISKNIIIADNIRNKKLLTATLATRDGTRSRSELPVLQECRKPSDFLMTSGKTSVVRFHLKEIEEEAQTKNSR